MEVVERWDPVDPGVRYPSYKSLDRYVDVGALRALDGAIRTQLERRIAREGDLRFYTGPFLADAAAPERPGTRMVYLSRPKAADSYYDLDRPDRWEATEEAADFPGLMSFIGTLPFARTARMLIMYDNVARPVSAHRDHDSAELCHEFVWFRTNLDKPFYVMGAHDGRKQRLESYCAWFDTVNQFHGAEPFDGLSFSIRVDGVFTDEFRRRIPKATLNPACTPSLWASLE